MSIQQIKEAAFAVFPFSSASSAWEDQLNAGAAVVGHIDESGNRFDVAVVDLTPYDGFEGDSLALARFYAAANAGAVLKIIEKHEELLAVLKEVRTWIGDGENSDGLSREFWTKKYAETVDMVDAVIAKMEA